ncbi:MutS family DNA mismatch repair protein [Aggregatilinea lenta]|uniref:MutS family DNA mismatch repair protein n=1 Tax=Aggregatilinea lenta TaxID=913108 RepID=UPI0013C3413D|nr:MutS family DNA mismatch repair protein [Aggregatilinea lenta]
MTPAKESRQRALQRQIDRVQQRETALQEVSSRFTWARLVTFVGGGGLTVFVLVLAGIWAWLAASLVWLAGFAALTRAHGRVNRTIARYAAWRAIKAAHIARLTLDWDHIPPARAILPRDDRPAERDLDLVGEHSLYRLLDTAASRDGSQRLRDWLSTDTPDPARIARRQTLVREMAPLALFRDKLRLDAGFASGGMPWRWEGKALLGWLGALEPPRPLARLAVVLTALALVNAALFALNTAGVLPPVWGLTFVVYAAIYFWSVRGLGDPFDKAYALSDPLTDLRGAFAVVERYHPAADSALADLCAPFHANETRPSVQLRRLTRVLSAASVRHNPLLWMLLSTIVPWDVYIVELLNRRQAALNALLPRWLDVWFELEALGGLANFAYLNPDATFPALHGDPGAVPAFEAHALGHPLIPDAARVCNDFTLSAPGDLALITGSNMAGKSTFLRTLGLNLCLAYAGGPVIAASLRTVPFRLYTCIRITDSVTDGISYFYAEVKCLRGLLDALDADHAYPVFYLIDEIFRGTNNRERLTGSRALIAALGGKRGVGIISTHDLELVTLSETLPTLKNYHFTEHIEDGRMSFDYTLRPGPSPSTNALTIMRMEGLPVPAN